MKFQPRRLPPRSAATPAISPAPAGESSSAVRQRRRGWLRRTSYSPVEGAELQGTAPRAAGASAEEEKGKGGKDPRRGWLRRLVSREHALRRRWKLSGATARLANGLRWTRVSSGGGGCASVLLDAVAFRVVYVVEAVVLGLALSCFFCCCGCQI